MDNSEIELKEQEEVIFEGHKPMTISCLTRWYLLLEAIDKIASEYEERGLEFDESSITKKAKPHKAITNYIKERYYAGLADVIIEHAY